jgi:hypothetical protein
VEMQNTPRCAEIEQRFPGLIKAIVRAHGIQLEGKKRKRGAEKRKVGRRRAS